MTASYLIVEDHTIRPFPIPQEINPDMTPKLLRKLRHDKEEQGSPALLVRWRPREVLTFSLIAASDLDSIRALFNEKEKELSLAVAKVEELTRQLEELRRGRTARDQPPASALELDKLRRELMVSDSLKN